MRKLLLRSDLDMEVDNTLITYDFKGEKHAMARGDTCVHIDYIYIFLLVNDYVTE